MDMPASSNNVPWSPAASAANKCRAESFARYFCGPQLGDTERLTGTASFGIAGRPTPAKEVMYLSARTLSKEIEGYFSILKRGINGVYHHIGKQHLHCYLSEFDFRFNSRHIEDGQRSLLAIRKVAGRRLKYRDSSGRQSSYRGNSFNLRPKNPADSCEESQG
jgi:hypothetical protein